MWGDLQMLTSINNRKLIQERNQVPVATLSVSSTLTHLFLQQHMRRYDYPTFADEETEAQRV